MATSVGAKGDDGELFGASLTAKDSDDVFPSAVEPLPDHSEKMRQFAASDWFDKILEGYGIGKEREGDDGEDGAIMSPKDKDYGQNDDASRGKLEVNDGKVAPVPTSSNRHIPPTTNTLIPDQDRSIIQTIPTIWIDSGDAGSANTGLPCQRQPAHPPLSNPEREIDIVLEGKGHEGQGSIRG
ncbi:uncharacterized protein EI90DRAFT_3118051 [Cantharellus anzutake]|uniref:uncharacterized protein n=1 Tax=Cantharellus anzutake TaxID=1750568 RepID=UPI001903002B|nr:uncharacterized protein EI90DRAFT_3118051 [Cantharellus anzutake]KAF8338991.1 hypothetical protein EI90DRAFT_3118051 [Cantharellus anzutake]